MNTPWSIELWHLLGTLLIAVILGLMFNQLLLFLSLASVGYLLWHLYNLYRLERWLHDGLNHNPPRVSGVWGSTFSELERVHQGNRKHKKRLSKMLKRFQKVTAALPDATVVIDENHEIKWFNDAAHHLLGINNTEDIGRHIKDIIVDPEIVSLLRSRISDDSINFISSLDPSRTLNLRVVPYAQGLRLLIVRDVSQRMRLEQVQRDFVANVSHELRTPLTVLSGFLETMIDARDKGLMQWDRSLYLMYTQTYRMQQIVEDLLMLSNLESGRAPVATDVVDVPAMLTMIRDGAEQISGEKKHAIHLHCDHELKIVGSEKELFSAFNNLISNAVRYTPAHGEITISWYADSKGAHAQIRDTGVGIAAHHLPRLTERFYRIDVGRSRDSGGTGLGLAIVKHVLNRHDARLDVESDIGKGSTFICNFRPERIVH